MRSRLLNFLMIFILLVGSNIHTISANEDNATGVVEVSGELEVIEDILELSESIENSSGPEYDVSAAINFTEDVEELFNNTNESLGDVFPELNSSEEDPNTTFVEGADLENYDYVNIEEIVKGEDLFEGDDSQEVKDPVKIQKNLFKDGKVELEFEVFEGSEVEIIKKEVISRDNSLEKIVVISSDVHFEEEVVVYTNLPIPAMKENILIFWETENVYVNSGINYFDDNLDGLVERISWVVPHLSTQTYSIEIVVENAGPSTTIAIEAFTPENGSVVNNPVEFLFNISYDDLNDVECQFSVDGNIYGPQFGAEGRNLSQDLISGPRNWDIYCWDLNDELINSALTGNFVVDNPLEIEMNKVYFVDTLVNASINSSGGNLKVFLDKPGEVDNITVVSSSSGPYPLFVDLSSYVNVYGDYTLYVISDYYEGDVVVSEEFYMANNEVNFPSNIEFGDSLEITVNFGEGIGGFFYVLEDGQEKQYQVFSPGSNDIEVSYDPQNEGEFDLSMEVYVPSENLIQVIDAGSFTVTSGADSKDPEIDLVFPAWKQDIKETAITFEYSATDNFGVANCSLEIYNATLNSADVYETGGLIFPKSTSDKALALEESPNNGEDIFVELVNFDPGNYIWEVSCFDDAGNEEWDFNHFTVLKSNLSDSSLTSSNLNEIGDDYEREGEVLDLIDSINEFLEVKESLGASELEVIDILDLTTNMNFYKKRLIQIDQDLAFNLRFMDSEKRTVREVEINDEIDEIKKDIITGIEVRESYEYTKSNYDLEMIDFLDKYLKAKDIVIARGALKRLSLLNEEFQKDLNVDVIVREVLIEYLEESRVLILVEKDISFGEDFEGSVLEILPEDIGEDVIFEEYGEILEGQIFEISSKDFDGKLIYYFADTFDLKDIEMTDSILFSKEGEIDSSPLTGFFVGDFQSVGIFNPISFLVGLLLVSYMGFFIFSRVRLEIWKKEPNVVRILDLISRTKMLVREVQLDNARNNYHQMGEIYKVLPDNCKNFFYTEIEKVRILIDKRDILNLLKEYEAAKSEFRKEDSIAIHQRISQIYKKLPQKYQEKVYQRLVKGQV